MKKMTLLAAMAVVAMTSCTKTENVDNAPQHAIKFENNHFTKAEATGSFNILTFKGETGKVYDGTAIKTDTYSTANGFAGGDQYYDGVNAYGFLAYGDFAAGALAVTTEDAALSGTDITFTATTGKEDLVTANMEVALADQNASVALPFKHALTKVRFTAVKNPANLANKIVITGLQFKTDKSVTIVDLKTGTVGEASGEAKTYEIASDFQTEVTGSATDVATTGNVFYVVPQTLATEASIVVNYTVDGVAATKTIDLATVLTQNMSVNYLITISLNKIDLSADVAGWETEIDK